MSIKKGLKIAYLSDTFTPQINGVVTSILTFKEQLEALGHDITVLCPKDKGKQFSTDDVWRFRSLPYPFQSEHRITSPISRKLKNFGKKGFDLLHIQTPFFMGHLGLYLGWKYKIPIIHTYHTYWYEYLHYFPLLPAKLGEKANLLLFTTKFCNRCQHVVVPSLEMKYKLLEDNVETPLSVIPTGIQPSPSISDSSRHDFRSRFNIPTDVPVAIFVGRLGKEKNVMFLLESFILLKKNHPSLMLLIVGDGPEKKSMHFRLKEAGYEESVVFTGYLEHHEVFIAYSLSKIILFPSKTETQGLSLLEGLSMGTPAVCLDVMGVKDVVGNQQGGLSVKDDLDEFVTAANRLLTDDDLYTELSKSAIFRSKQFSSVCMAKELESVYYNVLKKETL